MGPGPRFRRLSRVRPEAARVFQEGRGGGQRTPGQGHKRIHLRLYRQARGTRGRPARDRPSKVGTEEVQRSASTVIPKNGAAASAHSSPRYLISPHNQFYKLFLHRISNNNNYDSMKNSPKDNHGDF